MTIRKIATIIGTDETVKVTFSPDWQEYRVRIVGASAESTYFTDDKDDAIATAKVLCGTMTEIRIGKYA